MHVLGELCGVIINTHTFTQQNITWGKNNSIIITVSTEPVIMCQMTWNNLGMEVHPSPAHSFFLGEDLFATAPETAIQQHLHLN